MERFMMDGNVSVWSYDTPNQVNKPIWVKHQKAK
jgi:hypothetical protein